MLTLKSVYFSYNKIFGLNNISFSIHSGDILGIIGQSGCGKTTLLKLIYGKLDADSGKLLWNGKTILGPSNQLTPGREDLKYVTQDFQLMPYTSVLDNITKPLSRQSMRQNISRARELLEVVGLKDYENTKVKNLSGGQKQRVALAQALAKKPKLLLLDEPFSHIDQFFKNELRRQLFSYLRNNHVTCVLSTHDKDDILAFCDEILVLKEGKIVDRDTPNRLYKNNNNPYVASLFGDFNQINPKHIWNKTKKEKNIIIYPHEIKLQKTTKSELDIINQYYMGHYFKIELSWKSHRLFVHTPKAIDLSQNYKLVFDKDEISNRLAINLS
ncbi:ABC transporter ATP-binding protein [Flavobacterium sp. CS20]|uniref:ABC transporter ATP-binding protein n=1 Tax=Flavobacterium sp. CS20 TaxID=2775246 RepID=UPI001B39E95B|nr:ABC transporter ATP-binding protein [Flavobacterium sp. CS20]QTY28022.1 ABC transporter ATP-binding protein [Flavobacterium sp. CS20]